MSSQKREPLTTEDVQFLFNALRVASITWSGRKEALRLARKKVYVRRSMAGKVVTKFHWQCAICFRWYDYEKAMEVDHKTEIGGVTGFTGDWNETIARMFPRPVSEHLQVLCGPCHLRKTGLYMSANNKYERKKPTSL